MMKLLKWFLPITLILHGCAFKRDNSPPVQPHATTIDLRSSQATVGEFEQENGAIQAAWKQPVTLGDRLELLQVVVLKNYSDESITVQLPIAPSGKYWVHIHHETLNQGWCQYTITPSDEDHVIGSELYLLELKTGIEKSAFNYLRDHATDSTQAISLDAHGEKQIGLYGRGDGFVQLLSGAFAPQTLQTTQVVASCRSQCRFPPTNGQAWNVYRKPQIYWESQGYPGDSRACTQVLDGCDNWDLPNYTLDLCNRCAGWELQNGTNPNDIQHRFCWSSFAGRDAWDVEKHMATVQAGTEISQIHFDVDPNSQTWPVSFADGTLPDDEAARSIHVLSAVQF
jgi:hypothetical protein